MRDDAWKQNATDTPAEDHWFGTRRDGRTRIAYWLFDRQARLQAARHHWTVTREFIQEVWRRFTLDRVPLAAGAISFFSLLSLFPLLLLAVRFLVTPEYIENLVYTYLPADSPLALTIIKQVLHVLTSNKLLTPLVLVLSYWSGSQVFLILESAMNVAWNAQQKRPFWFRRGLAMLMLVIVGTFSAVAIFLTNLMRTPGIPAFIRLPFSVLIPVLLSAAIFALIYLVLPTKKVTFRTVVPGALFAAVMWMTLFQAFGWYAAHVARTSILYGSFWGSILLLLLFYYSAFILVLGAEISATYHHRLIEAGDKEERLVEERERVYEARLERRRFRQHARSARETTAYYSSLDLE